MRMRTVAAGNTAVGYVRVSTQEQAAEGISLDAQEARIRAYCTMRRLDLVDVVVDAGVSLHLIDMGGRASIPHLRWGACSSPWRLALRRWSAT